MAEVAEVAEVIAAAEVAEAVVAAGAAAGAAGNSTARAAGHAAGSEAGPSTEPVADVIEVPPPPPIASIFREMSERQRRRREREQLEASAGADLSDFCAPPPPRRPAAAEGRGARRQRGGWGRAGGGGVQAQLPPAQLPPADERLEQEGEHCPLCRQPWHRAGAHQLCSLRYAPRPRHTPSAQPESKWSVQVVRVPLPIAPRPTAPRPTLPIFAAAQVRPRLRALLHRGASEGRADVPAPPRPLEATGCIHALQAASPSATGCITPASTRQPCASRLQPPPMQVPALPRALPAC